MRRRYRDIDSLLDELRSISGMANTLVGESSIEWTVKKEVFSEQEMDTAEQETALGKAQTLAKRMEGVADFIEQKNAKSAAIALAKIIDDAKEFLNELGGAQEKEKKEPKPEGEKKKESEKKTGKDNFQKEKDKQEGTPKEKQAARADDGQQAAPEAEKKEEIVINGEIIKEASGKDPFGYGERFLAEVVEMTRKQQ